MLNIEINLCFVFCSVMFCIIYVPIYTAVSMQYRLGLTVLFQQLEYATIHFDNDTLFSHPDV